MEDTQLFWRENCFLLRLGWHTDNPPMDSLNSWPLCIFVRALLEVKTKPQ